MGAGGNMKNTVSLKKNELFLRAYKKGKKAHGKFFTMHYINNGLDFNRLGIKTGKKLAGAVKRNRVKRLIRESYRLAEPSLKTGYDIVFVAKDESLSIDSYFETSRAILNLIKKADLFTGSV